MSVTPGLGAFNKDKVANKFGIQLKPKDATQRSSTEKKSTTTTTASTSTSNVTKNKTISDFRTDNSTNGFLLNNNRTTPKTPEPMRKPTTSKSTSGLVNTSVKPNEQSNTLTSNVNHSTTKRPSITSTERAASPAPPNKRPSVPKSEAQIEHQKDQPLYRRQLSKPLDHTSTPSTTAAAKSAATTTTTAPAASPSTSLKR